MKKVKDIGIEKVIVLITLMSHLDKYFKPQIEIINKEVKKDFLLFCEDISEYSWIDKLGGIRRERTELSLNDVIHKAHTSIGCGIQVIKNPLIKLNEWELWDNGYIEGFARMDSDTRFVDWFVWQYIKMDKLELILKTFENELFYLDGRGI